MAKHTRCPSLRRAGHYCACYRRRLRSLSPAIQKSFRAELMKNAASSPATRSTLFILRQEAEEADMEGRQSDDQLILYGQSFTNRLLPGTAPYHSPSLLPDPIALAPPPILTVP